MRGGGGFGGGVGCWFHVTLPHIIWKVHRENFTANNVYANLSLNNLDARKKTRRFQKKKKKKNRLKAPNRCNSIVGKQMFFVHQASKKSHSRHN